MKTFDSRSQRDIDEAIEFFESGPKGPNEHFFIGQVLINSEKRKYEKQGFEHIKIAAESGIPDAIGLLADLYYFGKGTKEDKATGAKLYIEAAEKGFKEAYFSAGNELLKGANIEADYAKAFNFLSLADKANDGMGANMLGVMYLCGFYVEKDIKKAQKQFRRAAKLGNRNGLLNLNSIEIRGEDYDYAKEYLLAFRRS